VSYQGLPLMLPPPRSLLVLSAPLCEWLAVVLGVLIQQVMGLPWCFWDQGHLVSTGMSTVQ